MNPSSKNLATFQHRARLEEVTPGREYRLRGSWTGPELDGPPRELLEWLGPVAEVSVRSPGELTLLEIDADYRGLSDLLGRTASTPPGPLRDFLEAGARALEGWHETRFVLELPRGRRLELGPDAVRILGILNVTPDSFSDGGRYLDPGAAVDHALEMVEDGADAIDVGGESTRPGSDPVPVEEEIRRVRGVIEGLRERTDTPISIDTTKTAVARAAIEAGADIVNDVSAGLAEPEMFDLLADHPDVPVVLMHRQGTPKTMQVDPKYEDVTFEVVEHLRGRVEAAREKGIVRERILLDPGYGFGKRSGDNLSLLRHTDELRCLGRPLLIGLSRKSFLGRILGNSPGERETATTVANTLVSLAGAAVVRTHDVIHAREMVKILQAVRSKRD